MDWLTKYKGKAVLSQHLLKWSSSVDSMWTNFPKTSPNIIAGLWLCMCS